MKDKFTTSEINTLKRVMLHELLDKVKERWGERARFIVTDDGVAIVSNLEFVQSDRIILTGGYVSHFDSVKRFVEAL